MKDAPQEGSALASRIDHTLLRPDASEVEIRRCCEEGRRWQVAAVCVQPRWLPICVEELKSSGVAACTVLAFPHGALPSRLKADEARWAVQEGARELDMVVDLGAVRSGAWGVAAADIEAVVRACEGVAVKVILETSLLDDDAKRRLCALCVDAGAAFVKTSTGFAGGGATLADVRLLRSCVGERLGVKASGGIATRAQAEAMLAAGASRLGTSRTAEILA